MYTQSFLRLVSRPLPSLLLLAVQSVLQAMESWTGATRLEFHNTTKIVGGKSVEFSFYKSLCEQCDPTTSQIWSNKIAHKWTELPYSTFTIPHKAVEKLRMYKFQLSSSPPIGINTKQWSVVAKTRYIFGFGKSPQITIPYKPNKAVEKINQETKGKWLSTCEKCPLQKLPIIQ